jgi:hypothetical protein
MDLSTKLARMGADVRKIHESLSNSDGTDTKVEEGEKIIRAPRGMSSLEWQRRVVECAELMTEVMEGSRPSYHLKEAMTTSDFPLLYGDLLNRQLLGAYTVWPVSYPAYFKQVTVNDFRTLHMYSMLGAGGVLGEVAERAPYPETTWTMSEKSIVAKKYGRRYSITFEMLVNDDLNAWQDRPQEMAATARWSEEYLAASMLVDAAGPHASFFTSGNLNIVTGNPSLSILALQTAFTQIMKAKDANGTPIMIDFVTLVVPPALEIIARNILNATTIEITGTTGGGTSEQKLIVDNWMRGRVKLVVNPVLPLITTTGTVGDTEWFLIASSSAGPMPAFTFAKLRGHTTPELFVKSPDAMSLGGGMIAPEQGSFDNDSIDYKVRAFYGAAQGDPKMAVASKGTNS